MTNIKTPEEIAKEILAKAQVQFHEEFPACALPDSLRPDIAKAISAERNANLDKIRELEQDKKEQYKELFDNEKYIGEMERHAEDRYEKIKSLESKLAESEKLYAKMSQNFADANAEIVRLEAEAKAVREALHKYGIHDFNCTWNADNSCCDCGFTKAIRSLNNKQDN